MKRLRWLLGLWRMARGLCPLCNSSPPREDCSVCRGSSDYGPSQSGNERALWDYRFENWRWSD